MSRKTKNYSFLAWSICGLGALFYSYEYLLRIAPSVMQNSLEHHYQFSSGGFGLLSSFYYYAYVPMQIPVGLLMDRYGPRRLLTFACFLCALGAYMFAATNIFYVGALGRFLVGLGSSFAFVGVLKLATLWLPEDKLAFVAGLAAALGTIGAMIGDNVLGSLVQQWGWKQTSDMTAAFGFCLVLVLWFFIRDRNQSSEDQRRKQTNQLANSLQELLLITKNKQIWINGFYGCLVYLPTTVLAELWGIPYLVHAHNMSQHTADFANSMIFLGFTIGAPIMGTISDKLHRRKLPMAAGALGAFMAITAVMYIPNLSDNAVFGLLFLLGAFYSAQAIVFAVGRELAPYHAAGTAMAFTNMIVMLGGMFIQPLVGLLLDWRVKMQHAGINIKQQSIDSLSQLYQGADYQFALIVLPIGIFAALLLTFFLKETYATANE